jgi:hypothetical protein
VVMVARGLRRAVGRGGDGGGSVLDQLRKRERNLYESKCLVYVMDAHLQSNWKMMR